MRTGNDDNAGLKSSWEAKMKIKKERQELKSKIDGLREARDEKR